MALYDPSLPCPLRDRPVGDDFEGVFCFPCVGITNPRYEMLDDSCAHAECLRLWKKRDHFIGIFNEALSKAQHRPPYHLAVDESGSLCWIDDDPEANA